jgi:hypothetical protein
MQGQGPEWDEVQDEEHGPQKENTPLNTAGKGAAVAAVGGGSSVRVPWPADAETLLEQEAAGGLTTHPAAHAVACFKHQNHLHRNFALPVTSLCQRIPLPLSRIPSTPCQL